MLDGDHLSAHTIRISRASISGGSGIPDEELRRQMHDCRLPLTSSRSQRAVLTKLGGEPFWVHPAGVLASRPLVDPDTFGNQPAVRPLMHCDRHAGSEWNVSDCDLAAQ
jgi:hypothetical protein